MEKRIAEKINALIVDLENSFEYDSTIDSTCKKLRHMAEDLAPDEIDWKSLYPLGEK